MKEAQSGSIGKGNKEWEAKGRQRKQKQNSRGVDTKENMKTKTAGTSMTNA